MTRDFTIERDESGNPVKLLWLGDLEPPVKLTQAEKDAQKLRSHELIYGRRTK